MILWRVLAYIVVEGRLSVESSQFCGCWGLQSELSCCLRRAIMSQLLCNSCISGHHAFSPLTDWSPSSVLCRSCWGSVAMSTNFLDWRGCTALLAGGFTKEKWQAVVVFWHQARNAKLLWWSHCSKIVVMWSIIHLRLSRNGWVDRVFCAYWTVLRPTKLCLPSIILSFRTLRLWDNGRLGRIHIGSSVGGGG